MKYCINCGAQNDDDANFCISCGRPVDDIAPDPEQAGKHTEYKGGAHAKAQRTNRKITIVVPVILCAVVLIGTVAVVTIISRMDQQTTGDTSEYSPFRSANADVATITFASGGAEGTMEPEECTVGDSFQLPQCFFAKAGSTFLCWEDVVGNRYYPGDAVRPQEDMTFWAVWTDDSSGTLNSPNPSGDSASGSSTPATNSELARQFPRSWTGVYVGYSQYVEGNSINRTVRFDFSSVGEDGRLYGICYIGVNDPDAGTGSYYVEGNIDWNTRAITLRGTTWYRQEDVKYMRVYTGTANERFDTITGTCTAQGTGHTGGWSIQSN